MKTTIVLAVLAASALTASAQGTAYLDNYQPGCVSAPVYGPEPGDPTVAKVGNTASGYPPGTTVYTGAKLAGAGYRAALFAALGANRPEAELVLATNTTFGAGAGAGFFTAVTAYLTGVPEGSAATVQVRAWDDSSGLYPDWASASSAWTAGTIAAGKSLLLNIVTGGDNLIPPAPATYLCGLQSFNLYYRPVSWVGASPTSGNWDDPLNWSPRLPVSGDAVVFPANGNRPMNTNNLPGLVLSQVQFQGSNYVIYGNAFTLTDSLVSTNLAGANVLHPSFTLSTADVTMNVGGGASLTLHGNLSGNVGVTKTGGGYPVLSSRQREHVFRRHPRPRGHAGAVLLGQPGRCFWRAAGDWRRQRNRQSGGALGDGRHDPQHHPGHDQSGRVAGFERSF